MVFLYEQQYKIHPECEENYKDFYPIKEASNQYSFLAHLDWDIVKKITHIYFLSSSKLSENYRKSFKYYSIDYKKYPKELAKLLYHENALPEIDCNIEKRKDEVIISLIQKQTIIDENDGLFDSLKAGISDEIIIYLPYKEEITKRVLKEVDSKYLKIFTNSNSMRIKNEGKIRKIDSDLYKKIDENLSKVTYKIENEFSEPIYEYRPKSFFEIFEDSLLKDISYIKENGDTRVSVIGGEKLIATLCIQELLKTYTPLYIDLMEEVTGEFSSMYPLVFLNFHLIQDPRIERDLDQRTKKISYNQYIVLQSLFKKYSNYFDHYKKINLPDYAKILESISELFVAFLLDESRFSGSYRKLFILQRVNVFYEVLNRAPKLEHLLEIIRNFEKVNQTDLLENTEMWCFISSELDKYEVKPVPTTDDKKIKRLHFRLNNKFWEIIGLDKNNVQIFEDQLGIRYMILIFLNQQYSNRDSISVNELRYFAEKLDDNNVENNYTVGFLEKDRMSVLKAIERITTKFPILKKLYDKYIDYDNCIYSISNPDEIETSISYPAIDRDFFQFKKPS